MLPSMRLLRANVDYAALNAQLAPLSLADFLRWTDSIKRQNWPPNNAG